MSLQTDIAVEAQKWANLKVRYIHRGITLKGCDCSGLLVGILKNLGYLVNFVMPAYPFDWNMHDCKHNYLTEFIPLYCDLVWTRPEENKKNKKKIKINWRNFKPGDVLLFKYGKVISHAGILIDESGLFAHCYFPVGTKYSTLIGAKWNSRLVEVWRVNEGKVK